MTGDLDVTGAAGPGGARTDVAYVTYAGWDGAEDPDPELVPVLDALRGLGVTAQAHAWDAAVDWSAFRLVVVRSAWDYHRRRGDFLAWARAVAAATRLVNPYPVVERNTDKRYLRDLAAAGVRVVPTTWAQAPDEVDAAVAGHPGARALVVKPVVSAGAWDTVRAESAAGAAAHAAALVAAGRPVMVQPYLEQVDGTGEVAVTVLDGEPAWAVRKVPALTAGGHGDPQGLVPLTGDLVAAARRVLASEPGASRLLYARVDLVPDAHGRWTLMELELTEPSLFSQLLPDGPARLAAAVAARLGG